MLSSLLLLKQNLTSISESGGGGGGGRAKGGKGMGMGKGHKAKRREQEALEVSQSNMLQLDPDAPFRTHILFSGQKQDAPDTPNQSFLKMLTSGKIFGGKETGLPFGGNVTESSRYREEDPFTKGKQVTFDNDDIRFSSDLERPFRPERRPNSYYSAPPTKPERPPFTSLQEPYR